MLTFADEPAIPVAQLGEHPLLRQGRKPGKPVHASTIDRWTTRGTRGIKLETIRIGGVRLTSEGALRRFIELLDATTKRK